jgi:hypothetical protein
MTNKEITITTNERFVEFGKLDIGDICRNEKGQYFIKIEPVKGHDYNETIDSVAHLVFNAVCLLTGNVVQFFDNDSIIPVSSVKLSITF